MKMEMNRFHRTEISRFLGFLNRHRSDEGKLDVHPVLSRPICILHCSMGQFELAKAVAKVLYGIDNK